MLLVHWHGLPTGDFTLEWFFVDNNTIREKSSGYTLRLIKGTWADPEEIQPEAPKDSKNIRQAELLRRGLEFAYDRETEAKQA